MEQNYSILRRILGGPYGKQWRERDWEIPRQATAWPCKFWLAASSGKHRQSQHTILELILPAGLPIEAFVPVSPGSMAGQLPHSTQSRNEASTRAVGNYLPSSTVQPHQFTCLARRPGGIRAHGAASGSWTESRRKEIKDTPHQPGLPRRDSTISVLADVPPLRYRGRSIAK